VENLNTTADVIDGALPRFRLRKAYGATGSEADFERVAAQSVGLCRAGLRRAQSSRSLVVLPVRNPASHAQGLEGSRFTRWQLYRLLAGGSRE
jgi:hypothetical protein